MRLLTGRSGHPERPRWNTSFGLAV